MNVIVTHRRRESLLQLLAAHELGHHFAGLITADDGYPRQPDPAAFLATLEKHRLDPQATLAIGEREIDVLAGRAAGVCTCLLSGEAEGTVADYAVADLRQLLRLIAGEQS